MQTRPFGSRGPSVPLVGQGTWNLELDPVSSVAALRRGLDLGMTHIDTAEMYGDGAAEELVGQAIRGRRAEVFLVSKVLPENATREGTVAACERSLRRLGSDWLDCYLLHWPSSHPLAETLAGFEALVAGGKIRAYGVSNFDVPALEEALRIAGPGRIACNQVLYHLGERAIEHAVLPWCAAHGVALVGYSPFGSGSFPPSSTDAGATLAAVAAAHDATERQVALAFLLTQPSSFVIPKAASVEHVEDNAGAAALALSSDEVDALARAFPLGSPRELPVV